MARSGILLHAALLAATMVCTSSAFTSSAMADSHKIYEEPCPCDCSPGERARDRFVNAPGTERYTSAYVEEYFHAASGYERGEYDDGYRGYSEEDEIERSETANLNNFQLGSDADEPSYRPDPRY